MVGKRLAHYEIVEKLGEGGMGEVYVAEDIKLGRRIALKILPEKLAKDPERLQRFELEARSIAALNHPNIVTIFSVEEADGLHFLTMELVEGKNLSEIIPKNGLPLEKIFEIAIPLADAVSAAHNAGITHRDLKPANIMIGKDGRLRVLDFGLAKLAAGAGGDEAAAETIAAGDKITSEGKILGTVAYMSPEQAEGKPVDSRSDIFSAGVVLYEMATGEPPFKGDTNISTISSIIRDEPSSVTELRQNLPRHLGRIVRRCLAKEPERRYQTAIDLRNELQELKGEIDSGDLMASEVVAAGGGRGSSKSRLTLGIVGAVVVVIAATVTVVNLTGRNNGRTSTADAYAGIEMTRVTRTGKSIEAGISPDGRYVAHMVRDGDKLSLNVTQLSTNSTVEIIPPTEAYIFDPTFSLDGEYVYFCRRERQEDASNDLYRIPVLGGEPRKVIPGVDGTISFSPDGTRFTFMRSDNASNSVAVMTAAADGSDQRQVAKKTFPAFFAESPVWSPDGEVIVAPVMDLSGGIKGYLAAIPAEGGEERAFASLANAALGEIAWLPDGKGVVGVVGEVSTGFTGQLWEFSYPGGEARRLTTDLSSYDGMSVTTGAMSLVTALERPTYNLWVVAPGDEAQPRQITSGEDRNDGVAKGWTPDDRLVYMTNVSGQIQIWITNLDGSGQRQLTTDEGFSFLPAVSPDGRYIVFMSSRSGSIQVWRMDIDGSNPIQLTEGSFAFDPDISPDGMWVTFTNEESNICRIPIEGGEPQRLTTGTSNRGVISPDGGSIAYRFWDEERKTMRMAVIPFEGGEPTHSFDMRASNYAWAPDGNSIHFAINKEGSWDIWDQPLDGSAPNRVTEYRFQDVISSFTWSPDGTRIALGLGQTYSDIVLLTDFRR